MAHSIVTWSNTPDTSAVDEQIFTVTERRYFIIEDGIIKSFDGITWVDTELTEPLTDANYLEYGIEDLSEVTEAAWSNLGSKFELISWTEDLELVDNKWLELTTSSLSPLDLLNSEDEFELLCYSNEVTVSYFTSKSTKEEVDSGRLFKNEIDVFDTVVRVALL